VTAALTAQPRFVDPTDAFRARAETRAMLWHAGEYTLHEAVDGLQAGAEASGLVEHIGQDQVQEVMAVAFWPYREAQS
jgi:hypothetical protein